MRRRWGSQRFIDRCRLVQERLDRPAITTDIIVGFPGETDAEFAETIATSRAVGFSKIHIFPFSPRRGTPAAEMPNQVPKHVQQERSRELAAVEAELRDAYYRSLIGRRLRVLVESRASEERERLDRHFLPLRDGGTCGYAADEGEFVDVVAGEFAAIASSGERSPQLRSKWARDSSRGARRPRIRPVVRAFRHRYNRAFEFPVKFASSRRIEKWLFVSPSTGSVASAG